MDKTLSDREIASLDKNKLVTDRKISTLEDDYAELPDRSGKDDGYLAAVEIEDRPTAVLQSRHRGLFAGGSVAFSVMKSSVQDHVGINHNILFEVVLTNEGGGYDPNHGVFIAPISGVYVFSSSIMCPQNEEVIAAMVRNGNLVTRIYCHSDGGKYDQGSQTVVIQINIGDEVAVQNWYFADNFIWGTRYSSFSDYLV